MDRGAWQTAVHGVTKSWTCNIYHKLYIYIGIPSGSSGKESACQCGRHKRLRFDLWIGKISWRRAWQTTPVFLPGESNEQMSLTGYSPWGHKELDVTEAS